MRIWSRVRSCGRAVARRSRMEREMDAELRFHIEAFAEDLVRSGVPREEALRRARIEFGGMERAKEECREERGVNALDSLLQDIRYGLRILRKSPGFTTVAVLTLTLGIGANTAIFSILEAVLLRPLPYKDPGRLVVVADREAPEHGGFLYKDFEAWKAQLRDFENIAIYYRNTGISRVTLTGDGEPEAVKAAFVSADFFSTMGIWPEVGRVFSREEELRQVHVVVLSHGLWLRRFGGSPEVIGKSLRIDGIEWEIIGVMPASFQFPNRDQQLWAPITTNRSWQEAALTTNIDPSNTRLFYARWIVVGRLKTEVGIQQAQAEVDSLFAHLVESDPDPNRAPVRVSPLGPDLSGNTQLALFVLFGAVLFVLLIACSNVANLVLARGAGRTHEMALRAALGAGRSRLTRQLFTESALLGLISGGLGLLLASFCLRALIAFGPPDIPRLDEVRIDARVLGFTLGLSLFAAMVFGLIPAENFSE
jgi:predicted permease